MVRRWARDSSAPTPTRPSASGTCRASSTATREPTEFGWVTSDPDDPGARWRFEAASIAGATRLRYSVILGPGPSGITAAIESMPDKEPRILARRIDEHRANMTKVIEGIKTAAEADAAAEADRSAGATRPPLS